MMIQDKLEYVGRRYGDVKDDLISYDHRYARGYISRRINPKDVVVQLAGGRRYGELYIELPNWNNTRYAHRVYLDVKRGNKNA